MNEMSWVKWKGEIDAFLKHGKEKRHLEYN